MRSLPICRAFLNPFASSCKGSSTLGFVRRVTESDWRRPRSVGARQELVRVSVRAVDIFLSFAGSPPSAASGVSGGPSLCLGAQGRRVTCWNSGWLRLPRNAQQSCDRVLPAAPRSRPTGVPLCHRDARWASSIRSRLRLRSFPLQTVAADLSLSDGCPATRKPDQLQRRVSHSALQCLRRSRGTTAHNKCSDNDDATQRKRL